MTGTRVLKHVVLAVGAVLCFAPSAWGVRAEVVGSELRVTEGGNIQVFLPGDSLAQPCAAAPCPAGSATYPGGPTDSPAPYIVRNLGGGAVTAVGPGCQPVGNEAHCSRGGAAWGAFTVSLEGGPGNDTLHVKAPLIVSGEGNTGDTYWILGGNGDDTIVGSENNDFIGGGQGNDVIDGFAGNDIITGANFQGGLDAAGLPNGIDWYIGAFTQGLLAGTQSGTDRLYGGAGSDQMTDGDSDTGTNVPNADTLSGFSCQGTGGQTCPAAAVDPLNTDVSENDIDEMFWGHRTKAVVVRLDDPTPQGGCSSTAACTNATDVENETVLGFRGVYSGAGNDSLTGHGGAASVGNTFFSSSGNDTLNGLDGNDELIAGDGQDVLNGGVGADILNPGGHAVSTATNTTVTSDGADTVDGGADGTETTGDTSTVTSATDVITYAGRSDNLTLNLNNTTGWGAANENDTVSNVENVTGGHGADTITLRPGLSSIIEADPVAPELPHPGEPVLPSPPPTGYYSNDSVNARNGAVDNVYCGGDAADPDSDTVLADANAAWANADVTNVDCEIVDVPKPACSDGADNDGDGKVDISDPGCTSPTDNDEADPSTLPACADGRDNDRDGKIDFPADPGCAAAGDTDETDPGSGGGGSGGGGTRGDTAGNRIITGPATIKRVKVKKNGSFTLSGVIISCPSGNRNCSVRTTAAATARAALSYTLKAGRKAAARGKLSKKQLSQLKRRKSLKATVTIRVVRNGATTTKKVKVTFRR